MTVTSFRLQNDLAEILDQKAKELDRSKAWIINEALRAYFQQQNLEKERWLETMDALDSIKDGDLIEGDKVDDWLQSWGSEDEKAPPAP
ncbi:MAG: ribbon-helix-helix protein, CopG family [Magnetococcales bacterium]|nr:ribbon-helix-helix protein, CopG family [Magnetococcales bacterium]